MNKEVCTQTPTYNIGIVMDNTIMKGEKTLFVVGLITLEEILNLAKKYNVGHISLGANNSFNPKDITLEEYKPWDDLVFGCLNANLWVSLEFDTEHVEGILESGYCENTRFIPLISVKLPYINQLNYNTTIKLDDSPNKHSNQGVWTHHLHSLMSKEAFRHREIQDKTRQTNEY